MLPTLFLPGELSKPGSVYNKGFLLRCVAQRIHICPLCLTGIQETGNASLTEVTYSLQALEAYFQHIPRSQTKQILYHVALFF